MKTESDTTSHESTIAPAQVADHAHASTPTVRLVKSRKGYRADTSVFYTNNLLVQVGFLEFTNALDFPANVWNQVPIPVYAQVLMGLGGTVAILWSIFAFWDMHRSLKNVRLLWEERQFLKAWRESFDSENLDTRRLVRAWLDVNLREIGWELIDRVLMDVCSGTSGILVGTGALMAIRGDIDSVFAASNLLSGYIGNSFLAPFAVLGLIWAIFMWMRAGGQPQSLTKGRFSVDADIQQKMCWHGRKHRFYAVLNGLTAVVGTVGSIMSSTLWYGYVVIAPCVFTSIFLNWFWRHKLGYDRDIVRDKATLQQADLYGSLQNLVNVDKAVREGSVRDLIIAGEKSNATWLTSLLLDLGLYHDFCCRLLERPGVAEQLHLTGKGVLELDPDAVTSLDNDTLRDVAVATLEHGSKRLLYRERFLVEVFGRDFKIQELKSRRSSLAVT